MKNQGIMATKRGVHTVTELGHTSVGYAAAAKIILGGNVNVRQPTSIMVLTWRLVAKLTGTPHCAVTGVTACVVCASASHATTVKKLSQENIVNVTTTLVTGTMGYSVLARTMENVSVEAANVEVNGMWKATQHANAEQGTAPV